MALQLRVRCFEQHEEAEASTRDEGMERAAVVRAAHLHGDDGETALVAGVRGHVAVSDSCDSHQSPVVRGQVAIHVAGVR